MTEGKKSNPAVTIIAILVLVVAVLCVVFVATSSSRQSAPAARPAVTRCEAGSASISGSSDTGLVVSYPDTVRLRVNGPSGLSVSPGKTESEAGLIFATYVAGAGTYQITVRDRETLTEIEQYDVTVRADSIATVMIECR